MKIPFPFIFLFLSSFLSYGQEFELKTPNKKELIEAYENNRIEFDVIYYYLIDNYNIASNKQNVQRYEYDENIICAFTQLFEHDIKFSIESCEEAGGVKMILELPRLSEEKVKSWIELIYDSDAMDIPNEWYKGKNIYGPIGEEAGCYYELKTRNNKWIIDIYCGC